MKKYFKDFDVFIPTWVICICMFFWIFGFTFIIGIVLLIKQHFQKRNMFNKLSTLEENNTVKDIEIEEAKKKNECLTKDIKKMEQEKIEYLKHKSEDEAQINNISNELEHYKKEIQLIKERIKKYCITEKEIIKRKAAIQKLNEIHQNKINTMEEDFQKKYKDMNQELTMHCEKEKGKLQDEYDLKVQELNEDYEKLILDYEDKKNALQNEYDSKVKDLDKDYEDKENVLQSEYDSKIQEMNYPAAELRGI